MNAQHHSGLPPPIVISSIDLARLERLLESPSLRGNPAAEALLDDLSRAEVLAPAQMPDDVVGMHSTVECEDELGGGRHRLTLVFPNEADVDSGRVSVLAPVGSALLGLAIGQSIDWDAPGGRRLRLRVMGIDNQGRNTSAS